MVCISNIVAALASASTIGSAAAHPGETRSRTQISRDIKKRGALALKAKRASKPAPIHSRRANLMSELLLAAQPRLTNSEQLVESAPALRS